MRRKLRRLKSLKVVLGENGGYLDFTRLYSQLGLFDELESLSVESFDDQQLWKKKLKVNKLPSTLTHLRLSFHHCVFLYLNHPKLYASLPNLTSLELRQSRHMTDWNSQSSRILECTFLPRSLRSLRIFGGIGALQLSVQHFETFPSSLETLEFDGKVWVDNRGSFPSTIDLSRFKALQTLRVHFDRYATILSTTYPPTITDLALNCNNDSFQISDSFSFIESFPELRSLTWRMDTSFEWPWIARLPASLRYLSAKFNDFSLLSSEAKHELVEVLASRNDNFKTFGLQQPYLVPSLVEVEDLFQRSFPRILLPFFTRLRTTKIIFSDINAQMMHDKPLYTNDPPIDIETFHSLSHLTHLQQLTLSGNITPVLLKWMDHKGLQFPPLLTALHWRCPTHIPGLFLDALPTNMKSIEGAAIVELSMPKLARFHSLLTLSFNIAIEDAHPPSVALLNQRIPLSVTKLDLTNIQTDSPLDLPNLLHLAVDGEGVDLLWIPTLPQSLTSLDVRFKSGIDLRNSEHVLAALSFPRNLKRLHILSRYSDPDDAYALSTPQDLGLVFSAALHPSNPGHKSYDLSLNSRADAECAVLEAITRNLPKLIRLKFKTMAFPQNQMREPTGQVKQWMMMRIPFLRLLNRQIHPWALEKKEKEANLYFTQSLIKHLASTQISAISSEGLGYNTIKSFFDHRGIYVCATEKERVQVKTMIAAEPTLQWFSFSAYYLTIISLYAIHSYFGYQNLLQYTWENPNSLMHLVPFNASFRDWRTVFSKLFMDLSLVSAVATLPFTIYKLWTGKFNRWSKICPAPRQRLWQVAALALACAFTIPWNPLGGWKYVLSGLIAEGLLIQAIQLVSYPGPFL